MKKLNRNKVILIPPALFGIAAITGLHETPSIPGQTHPNILLIMVDQMQTPPEGYGPGEGANRDLREILGFRDISAGNNYTQFFPGFMRLRQNAVIMKKHYTASAASVPSRSCIMTGQYPNLTGVTQTDGLFKSKDDVPFLDSLGTPTIGDWFRAAGYTTHYFGKWHVSDPRPPDYLDQWGFSDWESSYPEPHGGSSGNLGVFRDVVFTENAIDFLNMMGTGTPTAPWFTVVSLVNPHDISAWPAQWMVPPAGAGVVPWTGYPPLPGIPAQGDSSRIDTVNFVKNGNPMTRIFKVGLNPDGFPQDNSNLPPTFGEDLSKKPRCQQDYRYKWGLGWGSKLDYNFIEGGAPASWLSPHPFQLQGSLYQDWSRSYIQMYFYLQYVADLHIRQVLKALDDNKLTDNTIVIFLSDHGDMTTAHGGMIQKWYNAYEESIRVPMIVSSPLVNTNPNVMREIRQATSSIDMAPTLLGLAGYTEAQLRGAVMALHGNTSLTPFPGSDLSPYIKGTSAGAIIGPDGKPRSGVLFEGKDMITERGEESADSGAYRLFLHRVDSTINLGIALKTGTVCQPNNMNAFCTGNWKLVQYVDPGHALQDEWEMYCLLTDPNETTNLVDYTTSEVRTDVSVPGMTTEQLRQKKDSLQNQLYHATGIAALQPVPDQAKLYQNQPNPFSSQTTIPCYTPGSGPVRLSVFDQAGREVRVLVDGKITRGNHTISFDAGSLPSGVYFVRLKSGQELLVKKLIVMR